MQPSHQRADCFRYDGYAIDRGRGEVRCTYSTGGWSFTERFVFGPEGNWGEPAVEMAVRLLFLMAGVSYYKTTAAGRIDLGDNASSVVERSFLADYYIHGLGEFAYRNSLDLSDLRVEGPDAKVTPRAEYIPAARHPLIPFGGGIDSIVTATALQEDGADAALCIVHPPHERFAPIEDAAAVTGLPITHVVREIDPLVRRSDDMGFFNGHVPVTAVITAAALVAAVLGGHDAVVMSNEWSASSPTLVHDGVGVNHQWSKGGEFEEGFAQLVAAALGPRLSVFSYLRSRSELWVAQEFAHLTTFHHVFRSCNRSFHQDRSQRFDRWCGECDKCCFIDLVLSPFMSAASLKVVFANHEPLENPQLEGRFMTLVGLVADAKPFECVGDVAECRAALLLAAARPDRRSTVLLQSLQALVAAEPDAPFSAAELLSPIGSHHIPDRYAPPDLLVRAH
jgi:hypothetical protein